MTAQTIVDEVDRTFLVLRVAAALDDSTGDGCGTRWCAHVCDPASPLAGLYAFADTLTEARDAVAVLAWTAVMSGELLPFGLSADDLAGIHVAVTRAPPTTPPGSPPPSRTTRHRGGAMTEQMGCRPRLVSDRADEPYSSWVRRANCAGQTAVFADDSRSDYTLAICGGCVVRRQCRAWALANAVEGVAGGMTEAERRAWRRKAAQPEPVVTVEDFLGADVVSGDRTWGRGRSDAILNAVARWTDKGESGRQIALRLGVTRRTVNRLRARCRDRKLIA